MPSNAVDWSLKINVAGRFVKTGDLHATLARNV
jgi:hypothetical protein